MKVFSKASFERILWVVLISAAIYGTITGTNWYRTYQEAVGKAESIGRLEVEIQSLSQTVQDKNAEIIRVTNEKDKEIARLKAIELR